MFRNWSRSNYRTTSVIERDLHPSIVLATNKRACVEFREPIRWGFDRETVTPCEKGEKKRTLQPPPDFNSTTQGGISPFRVPCNQ